MAEYTKNSNRLLIAICQSSILAGLLASNICAEDSSGESKTDSLSEQWIAFDKCAVLVEREVEVPALENGVIESLQVSPNQQLRKGDRIGHLDFDSAQMSLNAAKLELSWAQQVASDDTDVQHNEIALQEIKEELENMQSINRSVSASELRRLKLSVGKQEVALSRAKQKRNRDQVTAQLRKSEVEAASQNLQRHAIVAPFNGVVTKVEKHVGAYVRAGEAIISIRDLEHLLVDRLIDPDSVNLKTLVGSPVRVEVESTSGQSIWLGGKITSYDHHFNSRGQIRIHARIANTAEEGVWALLPGRYVTMHLESKHFCEDSHQKQFLTSTEAD